MSFDFQAAANPARRGHQAIFLKCSQGEVVDGREAFRINANHTTTDRNASGAIAGLEFRQGCLKSSPHGMSEGCFLGNHDEWRSLPMAYSFRGEARQSNYKKTDTRGRVYIDYRTVDDLRRLMTPNGKIYSRKRLGVSAHEQRLISQAIKRARFMALLPYTSATL